MLTQTFSIFESGNDENMTGAVNTYTPLQALVCALLTFTVYVSTQAPQTELVNVKLQ